jgi:hypothetical protein
LGDGSIGPVCLSYNPYFLAYFFQPEQCFSLTTIMFACAYQPSIQQYFSLTINQHKPESASQKPSSEQSEQINEQYFQLCFFSEANGLNDFHLHCAKRHTN